MPENKGWWWPRCSDLLQVLRAKGERQQLLQPLDNVGAICFGQVDIPVCAKLEEEKEEPDEGEEEEGRRTCTSSSNYSYNPFFSGSQGASPSIARILGWLISITSPRGYFGLRSCVFTSPG